MMKSLLAKEKAATKDLNNKIEELSYKAMHDKKKI